jgi:hypothetical protein
MEPITASKRIEGRMGSSLLLKSASVSRENYSNDFVRGWWFCFKYSSNILSETRSLQEQ